MKPSRLVPGLLALVLVVAAISVAFPITVPEEYADESAYAGEPVRVEGGELDADTTELWAWTQRALDRNVNVTPTVRIQEFDGTVAGTASAGGEATQFQRLLVYDDPDDPPRGGVLAYVTAVSPDVFVNAERLPAVKEGRSGRTVDGLLVHEYTHVVQFQSRTVARSQPSPLSATNDDTLAYQATVEGGAEFVADAYTEESALDRVLQQWNDPWTSAATRYGQWPYVRGLEYLSERFEEPSELWTVYEDRPQSTAAILRGETGGEGPPERGLDLELDDHHVEVDDRPGAAFAEVALSKEIDAERARDVAAGWQWGALRTIEPDSGTLGDRSLRHVWVTEWQSEAEADAFEDAMTEYLDGRWRAEGDRWTAPDGQSFDLVRTDDGSIALLVGPESFLEGTTVTAEGDEYAIVAAGGTTASTSSIALGEPGVDGESIPGDATAAGTPATATVGPPAAAGA